MPAIRTQERQSRPRQDPVSCQLCRSKKLKCDRQRPCSNCASRKVTCEFKGEQPLSVDRISAPEDDDIRAENRSMKARLQRLEQAVFGTGEAAFPQIDASIVTPLSRNIGSSTTTPKIQTEAEQADEDSTWLESIGAGADAVLPQFVDRVIITKKSIAQTLAAEYLPPERRTIVVPTYDVAMAFLEAYAEHLDAMQHIVHMDSARACFERTYTALNAGHEVDPGVLTFILGICAGVGFYWTVGSSSGQRLFHDQNTALKISTIWAKQSLYAMEQMRVATATSTLEGVQGSILLMFIYYHMEGFTSRVKMMLATAIAMARDIGMHRVDAPGARPPPLTQAGLIEIEVRRKCWWHMACTDWFMSFIGGPQEGMYSINPKHMNVRIPRNLNHDDLGTKDAGFSRSLDEPTIMSYYQQRIKLGVICREVADDLWSSLQVTEPEAIDYGIVTNLDAKFEHLLRELPRFLRHDIPIQQLKHEYGDLYTRQISVQSAMANLMINTRRCKLHMPFLVRAKANPRFAFSRNIGLQAARAVFKTRERVQNDQDSFLGGTHLRLGGILQHIFYATVVLVMDLCVNKQDYEAQVEEVKLALKIMEDSKDTSQMGDRFYDSLIEVLRKHNVKLSNTEAAMQNVGAKTHPATAYDGYDPVDPMPTMQDVNGDFEFDGMWQDLLDSGPMLNPRDWDALLSDLDMRVM